MSTHTQILYQIIFSTKDRKKVLTEANRDKLFRYIWGILKSKNCTLYQINGIDDHIHIATHIHPNIALSILVKDIKVASTKWIRDEKIFPDFESWQSGYGAFTYTYREKETLMRYVKNQKEHHKIKSFKDEYIELLNEHGVVFDEKYLL